jgi:ABC-2 type transport system ATP-binding protein
MIELKHLTFSYRKGKRLFDNLDLSLQPGTIYGLLGRNGAGKSTLLKHICGMLYPDSGECKILGLESKERNPSILQDVYLVPEEFELPEISVKLYAKINAVFYPKFDATLLSNLLKEFELREEEKLSQLSYGQKKKFLIAFALATNARILILDEPTNGLDIPSKSQFRKIIASCLDENRILVISTHQVRDLENMIDTIVILEEGKIVFNKSVADISKNLRFEKSTGLDNQAVIEKNNTGEETKIDIELLFNEVVKNSERINANFINS